MFRERERFDEEGEEDEIGKRIKREIDAYVNVKTTVGSYKYNNNNNHNHHHHHQHQEQQQMGRRHMLCPPSSAPGLGTGTGTGTCLNTITPCAACKLLRRRCAEECPFSPYFSPHEPQKFAAVHKVFGASNVSKMLMEVPDSQRADAANSLVYEANVRLRDPVYGCMGAISALQQQVQTLQAELNAVRAEILKYKYREAANTLISAAATTLPISLPSAAVAAAVVAALPQQQSSHTQTQTQTPPDQHAAPPPPPATPPPSSSTLYTPPPRQPTSTSAAANPGFTSISTDHDHSVPFFD